MGAGASEHVSYLFTRLRSFAEKTSLSKTQGPGVLVLQIHTGWSRVMPWSSRVLSGSVWALRPDARCFRPAAVSAWRTISVTAPSTTGAPVRISDRLLDEHQDTDLTYGIVRHYVSERRLQIRIEAGLGPVDAFITQSH